jgi:hypothetical protein
MTREFKVVTRFNGYPLIYDVRGDKYFLAISIYPHSAARFRDVESAFRYFLRHLSSYKKRRRIR